MRLIFLALSAVWFIPIIHIMAQSSSTKTKPIPRSGEGNVREIVTNCKLTYDMTEHSLSVTDTSNNTRIKVWRVPEPPQGYHLGKIEIDGPLGVKFTYASEIGKEVIFVKNEWGGYDRLPEGMGIASRKRK